ncbi:hypothetical protein Baya_3079 [Bagarius yarrelli]|uniref:Uncharacterized protein n=1 Tax=Bagarius yarrelli TaxID=175774 RepID=A0A556TUE1_BAGYA|nr:hypothetical protein Baya_3079 [Bagarius yarrelli]
MWENLACVLVSQTVPGDSDENAARVNISAHRIYPNAIPVHRERLQTKRNVFTNQRKAPQPWTGDQAKPLLQ